MMMMIMRLAMLLLVVVAGAWAQEPTSRFGGILRSSLGGIRGVQQQKRRLSSSSTSFGFDLDTPEHSSAMSDMNRASTISMSLRLSPDMLARIWQNSDPKKAEYSPERLAQRLALAELYHTTGGASSWINNTGWLSYDVHECEWFTSYVDSAAVTTTTTSKDYNLNISKPFSNISQADYNMSSIAEYNNNNTAATANTSNTITSSAPASISSSICDEQGLYKVLDLQNNGLRGSLPTTTLADLVSLTDIILSHNQLTGTALSADLVTMPQLSTLSLENNTNLGGAIPTEIGLSSTLTFLWLTGNSISSSIPSQMGNAYNLRDIMLEDNMLTGTIPPELANITGIPSFIQATDYNETLTIFPPADNIIAVDKKSGLEDGTIQRQQLVPGLERLHLGGNIGIDGPIPIELAAMPSLISFTFNGTSVSGSLSSDFCTRSTLVLECSDLVCGCNCICPPSPAPTLAPTMPPTKSPTLAPTPLPTLQPTPIPTTPPTKRPTPAPTVSPPPTNAPTPQPTPLPTAQPTPEPTREPTPQPTGQPTRSPTRAPTRTPTRNPTPSPTKSPTKAPTRTPTKAPTKAPTPAPTPNPTDSPTPAPDPTRIEQDGTATFFLQQADRSPNGQEEEWFSQAVSQLMVQAMQTNFIEYQSYSYQRQSTSFNINADPIAYVVQFTGQVDFFPRAPPLDQFDPAIGGVDLNQFWGQFVAGLGVDDPGLLAFVQGAVYQGSVTYTPTR